MKSLIILSLLLSFGAFAQEQSTEAKPKSVEELAKEGKRSRRKKVEMCHDCGRPEEHCECEGEEHRKEKSE